MLTAISDPILTLLFPQQCHTCHDPVENTADGVACSECWSKTRIFNSQETLCKKCGTYLGESTELAFSDCHQCGSLHFDTARAAGLYEQALASTVIQLKKVPTISKRAAQLFAKAFDRSDFSDTTLIVPVPLSRKRLLERGFNQAEILAKTLSKYTGIPTDFNSLQRSIHTPIHRAGMDKKARELSVKNAFVVSRPKLIEGQKVLLVDDIFTSGSTASYCAKALKKSGAAKVNVLTLARAA